MHWQDGLSEGRGRLIYDPAPKEFHRCQRFVRRCERPEDDSEKGAQIDLLIDRDDGVVNVCEMKFSGKQYALKEVDDLSVRSKKAAFRRETGTRKAVHVTYVTTFGLVRNAYANSVQSEVTLDDLFRA